MQLSAISLEIDKHFSQKVNMNNTTYKGRIIFAAGSYKNVNRSLVVAIHITSDFHSSLLL